MFITITGKEECILFLQVIFAVFTKKMFITFKKLMFAIITGKYILITGNIYRYYKECESHIKVMFVIFTRMYSQ